MIVSSANGETTQMGAPTSVELVQFGKQGNKRIHQQKNTDVTRQRPGKLFVCQEIHVNVSKNFLKLILKSQNLDFITP